MASGYIGKISAVVTANTADLSKKLRSSTQEWNSYGASLNRSLQKTAASATSSIDKILTPLQRLEKQLKAATSSPLNIRTEDQANQIRRLTSAAEQINRPLENAAGSFQKLSSEVQAGFAPALGRAQNQAQALFKILEVGRAPAEKYFEVVQNRVDRTTQALQRLTQAQQIASRGFTGNELQFANPAVFESLNRSATLSRQAGGLSADALSGEDIGSRVSKLNSLSQSISAAFSRLESIRISPDVDTSEVQRAERELASLLSTARSVQDGLQSAIQVQGNIGASTPFMSTRDPSGRPLQERFALQQRIREQEARQVELATAFNEALSQAKSLEQARLELASKRLNVLQQESNLQSFQGASTNVRDRLAQIESVRQQTEAPRGIRQLQRELDERSVRGYAAQVEVLKTAISGLSSQAAAPAVASLQRLRQAIDDAMRNGTIRTEQTSAAIKGLVVDATRASAAVAGVSEKSLGRSVARAGDVGRQGFDKFSLALNQAAFAIDDFFSATGGLEFKIRAVQNNLTQLGFILGGTAGLFASLGFAIAGQAAVALVNFLNEGRKTEDMVKALSDSLARQREVANNLASAFDDMRQGIEGDVFSDAARDADRLTDRIQELVSAFESLRKERILQASTEAQVANANVNRIQREIESTDDPSRLILLQRDLVNARREQSGVADRLAQQVELPDVEDRFRDIISGLERQRVRRAVNIAGGFGNVSADQIEAQVDRRVRGILDLIDFSSTEGALAAIRQRFSETRGVFEGGGDVLGAFTTLTPGESFRGTSREELTQLRGLEVALEGYDQASDALVNAAKAADEIRASLAEARGRLEQFGDGIESVQGFSDQIDARGRTVDEALSKINEAAERLTNLEIGPEDFVKSLNEAAAPVDAEAKNRAKLVSDIEATFNKEERARLDAAKKAEEDAARKAESDAKRAEEDLKSSIERGRQLLLGESGRRAEQIAASIGDIRNAGGGRRQIAGFLAEQARQIAPAVFAAGDQIRNAVATGPNRAALSASDITTQQGSSELNRLLRGDDPAREQNIVELRKQTAELVGLREDLKNLGVAD